MPSQDPVACTRRVAGIADDIGAERDDAPERAEADLELLVHPALGIGRAAMAGDQQLAALDLQAQLGGVDPRELGVHDRARRVALVEDVHGGEKPPRRRAAGAVEDVAEQLVHLAAHALEVGEEVRS